ncbi:hypothetical protein IFM89_036100 [Coptis chinensis]|uniref:Uncharacterized protein n=1 Tax=Coptis chinensis TaxID=261450 RepID=A0A835IWR4_9MAGN|nr:hypothetical protein IFM89_036100 [Coptis chinensis]
MHCFVARCSLSWADGRLGQVLCSDNPKYGYNVATEKYEDLMTVGIIDPTKRLLLLIIWCCLDHAASVARTFLTSDVIVVGIKEPVPAAVRNHMDNSGYGCQQGHGDEGCQ